MDIFTWLAQLSESESLLIQNPLNANDLLFVVYIALSLLVKRSSYMAAFFMSCLLFEISFFDGISEYNLYLLTFLIYTYVLQACPTDKSRVCCGIILFLSITSAIDSVLYGESGYYGATETIVYNNIEYLALYAHCLFIGSLIPYRRIKDSIRHFIGSIMLLSRNNAYFSIL